MRGERVSQRRKKRSTVWNLADSIADAAEDAIRALRAMLPAEEDTWRHQEEMREFVTQITSLAGIQIGATARASLGWPGTSVGSDHPDTLASRNDLASAYESAGRPDEAIGFFEQVVAESERVLGIDHPVTLTSRASVQGRQR